MASLQNIHIGNYEKWFLLYVDGELSAEQVLFVEGFIKQYPHLQVELDALLKTVFRSEPELKFSNKNLLKRNDDVCSEDELIDYIHNELNADQYNSITNNPSPALASKIDALKNTISKVDSTLHFPNKARLYKKPEVKSLSMYFTKLTVAAAITGAVALITYLIQTQPNLTQRGIAGVEVKNNAQSIFDTSSNIVITTPPITQNEKTQIQTVVVPEKKTNGDRYIIGNRIEPIQRLEEKGKVKQAVANTQEENTSLPQTHHPIAYNQEQTILTNEPAGTQHSITSEIAKETMEPTNTEISTKKNKGLLKRLAQRAKDNALAILTDGDDHINVAGFAINIKEQK